MSQSLGRTVALRIVALTVVGAWAAGPSWSHEVRPGLLQITEQPDNRFDILWKQPSQGMMAVRLVPHISRGLLERAPSAIETASNFQIHVWLNLPGGSHGLDGRTLQIEGLERTITNVLVSITLANGDSVQHILHPHDPSLTFHLHKTGVAVPAYMMLGVEHILGGFDHLAFVLSLLLLVRQRKMLIKTVTAFTVAHSITLAATTFHLIAVHPSVIEALVALSILFVAVELVHSHRGKSGLTVRYPWLIAFAFGLLHGSAFAGALAEIGLPPNSIPLSLFLFNVGVELGQLVFIAVALSIGWALARMPKELPAWTRWVPPYAIGCFSAFCFLDRLHTALR